MENNFFESIMKQREKNDDILNKIIKDYKEQVSQILEETFIHKPFLANARFLTVPITKFHWESCSVELTSSLGKIITLSETNFDSDLKLLNWENRDMFCNIGFDESENLVDVLFTKFKENGFTTFIGYWTQETNLCPVICSPEDTAYLLKNYDENYDDDNN